MKVGLVIEVVRPTRPAMSRRDSGRRALGRGPGRAGRRGRFRPVIDYLPDREDRYDHNHRRDQDTRPAGRFNELRRVGHSALLGKSVDALRKSEDKVG